jgi:hypothetical protein
MREWHWAFSLGAYPGHRIRLLSRLVAYAKARVPILAKTLAEKAHDPAPRRADGALRIRRLEFCAGKAIAVGTPPRPLPLGNRTTESAATHSSALAHCCRS